MIIAQALLEGITAGLILSVFVGPIFFTMLQLGVEHGFKAAFMLALGQWTSDFIYIFLAFWGAVWVEELLEDAAKQETFIAYSGTIGGILLLLFGAGLLLTRSVSTKAADVVPLEGLLDDMNATTTKTGPSRVAYVAYWGQGFLINTVNPTPLLFWMGLMALAISRDYTGGATATLYGGVMTTVIVTDCLKIYLARVIRNRLKEHHFLYVRRLAGAVLAGFGLVLLLNVWL